MRIALVSEFFPTVNGGKISGGVESRTFYLAKELSKRHEICVVTSWVENSKAFEIWGKLKIFRVGRNRKYVRKMSMLNRGLLGLAIVKKIMAIKPDVVDANNGVVYLFAWAGAKLSGAKIVYWVPDIVGLREWIREQGLIGGLVAWILESTIFLFPADKTIALSETTKSKIASEDSVVIYPGV